MGYTHYISNKPAMTDEQWKALMAGVKKLFAKNFDILAGPSGDVCSFPIIEDEYIGFNGIGEDSHESAVVRKEAKKFDFCKTAQKPYDKVVVEFYKLIRKHAPGTELSSDGGSSEAG